VSQPTIREALRALDVMGLVNVQHGRGTFVTADSGQFLRQSLETMLQMEHVGITEIVEVRRALQVLTVTLAVERATDEEIAAIDEAEKAFEANPGEDPVDASSHMLTFVAALSTAAHNPLLAALEYYLAQILIQIELYAFSERPAWFWKEGLRTMHTERRNVLEALAARDQAQAVAAVQHYHDQLQARLADDPAMTGVRMSDPGVSAMFDLDVTRF
jgi:GntR family transcriptional regulator, transcriptional repressor for pyruvate dehydrogenase complex